MGLVVRKHVCEKKAGADISHNLLKLRVITIMNFGKKKPKIVLSCLSDVQSMFVMNNNINGDISSHVSGCN